MTLELLERKFDSNTEKWKFERRKCNNEQVEKRATVWKKKVEIFDHYEPLGLSKVEVGRG